MFNSPFRSPAGPSIPARFTALALALALVIVAGCTIERPTEATSGIGPEYTTAVVNCANGCKDTFTDADGTLLTSHSPDVGGFSWKYVEGSGGDYRAKIANNAVGIEDPDSLDYQYMYLIPEITGEDAVEIDLEFYREGVTPLGGNYSLGIILRGDGTLDGGYQFHLQLQLSGTSDDGAASVELFRNNIFFPGSSRQIPRPASGIHKFRAEVSGGTLRAYMDGVLIASANDPSPLPAGNPGFWFGTQTGDLRTGSLLRITSFEVRPCPPTDDPLLQPLEVRRGLIQALLNSQPNTAPELRLRRERGGVIYRSADGTYHIAEAVDPLATVCDYSHARAQANLALEPTDTVKAGFHTHPHKTNDRVYDDCARVPPGRYGHTKPSTNGGGSKDDWDNATASQFSEYVITNDGTISRLDPNIPAGSARRNNKNRWAFNPSNLASCFTKIL